MGIGKLLVRGLGAGLQGYGKYLTSVGEEQAAERKTNALMMREMALAEYRERLNEGSADRQLGRQKDLATHSGAINTANAAAELGAREVLATRAEERGEQREVRAETRKEAADRRAAARDYSLWEKKLGAETRAEINKAKAAAAAEGDGFVGSPVKAGDTGTYVFFTKSGRQYDTGVKFVPDAVEGGGTAVERARARSGGAPSPVDTPTGPAGTEGLSPGAIIVDPKDRTRRLRLNPAGRWVPIPR